MEAIQFGAKVPPTVIGELDELIDETLALSKKEAEMAGCPPCNLVSGAILLEKHDKLNKSNEPIIFSEKSPMVAVRETGIIVGGQFAAKFGELGLKEADKYFGLAAKPVWQRAHTWVSIVGGLALTVGGLLGLKKYPDVQLTSIVAGTHLLTEIVDIGKEAMVAAPAAAAVVYRPAAPVAAPPAPAAVTPVAAAPAIF
jgi:hypothetical protein